MALHAQLLNCASRAICPSAPFRHFAAWLSLCPCTLCFTHPSAVVCVDCSDSQGPSDDEWLYLEDSSNNPLVYEMCLVAAEEATGSNSAPSCTSALPAAPDSHLRSAARRVPRQTSLSSQGAKPPSLRGSASACAPSSDSRHLPRRCSGGGGGGGGLADSKLGLLEKSPLTQG